MTHSADIKRIKEDLQKMVNNFTLMKKLVNY